MKEVFFLAFLVLAFVTNNVVRGCRDVSNQCSTYTRYCNHATYKAWTFVNCKRTCRFCYSGGTRGRPGGSCQDAAGYQARCNTYKQYNFCKTPQYIPSMKFYCRRTCGYCGSPVHGMWSAWSDWGQCGKPCGPSNQVRTRKCNNPAPRDGGKICVGKALVGRTCNKRPCVADCANVAQWDGTCPYWKKQGHCTAPLPGDTNAQRRQFYNFMLLNCKKSCGFCTKVVKVSCPGGCTQICNVVGNNIKCSCFPGYQLKADGKTCEKPKPKVVCGRNKEVFSIGRIVGGVNAVAHRWEWQGGMYYYDEFVCGGSLIDRRWFLTAAHCVQRRTDETQMHIRLGDHDRYKEETGEQNIKVKKIIIHEGWDILTLKNDIALLQLEDTLELSDTVGKVCLPRENINPKKGSTCYITGWGKVGINDWEADILQEAKLPIVPNDECGKRNVDRQSKSRIQEKMICGGYTDPAVQISGCMGDSGGPYVCKDNNKWYLQGVVSWGSNRCNSTHRYTVFTRVNKYVEWIASNILKEA